MDGVSGVFSHMQKLVSNGMLESRVPDRESQMRLKDRLLEPSQFGPITQAASPSGTKNL